MICFLCNIWSKQLESNGVNSQDGIGSFEQKSSFENSSIVLEPVLRLPIANVSSFFAWLQNVNEFATEWGFYISIIVDILGYEA